jgi:hypothetical protein
MDACMDRRIHDRVKGANGAKKVCVRDDSTDWFERDCEDGSIASSSRCASTRGREEKQNRQKVIISLRAQNTTKRDARRVSNPLLTPRVNDHRGVLLMDHDRHESLLDVHDTAGAGSRKKVVRSRSEEDGNDDESRIESDGGGKDRGAMPVEA